MAQIHKRFTDDQVKDLIGRYLLKKIERKYIQEILNIGKARFFELLQQYRINPGKFSIQYVRKTQTRTIDPGIEKSIIKELKIDKKAIQNKEIPLRYYNYSYVKDRLETVILQYGCPYKYYVDSHSIFRFVRGRDELWLKHHKLTDESTNAICQSLLISSISLTSRYCAGWISLLLCLSRHA